jgi:hypothetical protein
MMDNAFPIKKHNQQHQIFDRLTCVFFCLSRPFIHALQRLHLGFNITPIKFLPSLQQTFTYTRIVLRALSLSLIRTTACAHAQFSGCSSTTNAHSETGQMAVCCQNLTLCALSSRSALSVLVGAPFKKFSLFLFMSSLSGTQQGLKERAGCVSLMSETVFKMAIKALMLCNFV